MKAAGRVDTRPGEPGEPEGMSLFGKSQEEPGESWRKFKIL